MVCSGRHGQHISETVYSEAVTNSVENPWLCHFRMDCQNGKKIRIFEIWFRFFSPVFGAFFRTVSEEFWVFGVFGVSRVLSSIYQLPPPLPRQLAKRQQQHHQTRSKLQIQEILKLAFVVRLCGWNACLGSLGARTPVCHQHSNTTLSSRWALCSSCPVI